MRITGDCSTLKSDCGLQKEREKTNPEVLSYLATENAYAEQLTSSQKPLEEKLYRETISQVKQDDKSVPYSNSLLVGGLVTIGCG